MKGNHSEVIYLSETSICQTKNFDYFLQKIEFAILINPQSEFYEKNNEFQINPVTVPGPKMTFQEVNFFIFAEPSILR